MSSQLIINPVGRVRAEEGRFQLIIKPQFKEALTELAGFSLSGCLGGVQPGPNGWKIPDGLTGNPCSTSDTKIQRKFYFRRSTKWNGV